MGAVCHGPAGLVNVTLSDRAYLVAGKSVAGFTNDEEAAVGLTEVVPFLLQSRLQERGAKHTGAPNFEPHVVADGRLVTGQNPASTTGAAERAVRILADFALDHLHPRASSASVARSAPGPPRVRVVRKSLPCCNSRFGP